MVELGISFCGDKSPIKKKEFWQIYSTLLFSLVFCFSSELQESYEQCFPPAEDDGDPTHEQRLSGHPAAKSAGVSTGSKQRRVRFETYKYAFALFFCFIFLINIEFGRLEIIKPFFIFLRNGF